MTGYAGGLVSGLVLGFNFSTGNCRMVSGKVGNATKSNKEEEEKKKMNAIRLFFFFLILSL